MSHSRSSRQIALGQSGALSRFADQLGSLDAHLVLNVFGLIGLVIAGTLSYFAATQVRSRMSPPRHPDRDARHVRRDRCRSTHAAASGAARGAVGDRDCRVGHNPMLAAALEIWLIDIAVRAGWLLTTTQRNDHV